MKTISVSRHVNAPVERVEALLTDIEHAAEHIRGIKRVEMLTEGPFGVGTRWRETRVMFGKEATEEMEVTEYVPQKYYAVEAESHGTRYRSVFKFEPSNGGTNVTLEFGATPISRFARAMSHLSGLMAGTVIKFIEEDLADVARIAESAERESS